MQLARHPKRPHAIDYIERLFAGFQELHGDRFFGDDKAIVGGLAYFEGQPVMVIGQQKGRDTKAEVMPQFRHAQARGLSQGAAADAACGKIPPARSSP